MKSGRPRGPGKAFKNVGGEVPHILRVSRAPGAGQTSKRHTNKSGQTAFRYPERRKEGKKSSNERSGRNS